MINSPTPVFGSWAEMEDAVAEIGEENKAAAESAESAVVPAWNMGEACGIATTSVIKNPPPGRSWLCRACGGALLSGDSARLEHVASTSHLFHSLSRSALCIGKHAKKGRGVCGRWSNKGECPAWAAGNCDRLHPGCRFCGSPQHGGKLCPLLLAVQQQLGKGAEEARRQRQQKATRESQQACLASLPRHCQGSAHASRASPTSCSSSSRSQAAAYAYSYSFKKAGTFGWQERPDARRNYLNVTSVSSRMVLPGTPKQYAVPSWPRTLQTYRGKSTPADYPYVTPLLSTVLCYLHAPLSRAPLSRAPLSRGASTRLPPRPSLEGIHVVCGRGTVSGLMKSEKNEYMVQRVEGIIFASRVKAYRSNSGDLGYQFEELMTRGGRGGREGAAGAADRAGHRGGRAGGAPLPKRGNAQNSFKVVGVGTFTVPAGGEGVGQSGAAGEREKSASRRGVLDQPRTHSGTQSGTQSGGGREGRELRVLLSAELDAAKPGADGPDGEWMGVELKLSNKNQNSGPELQCVLAATPFLVKGVSSRAPGNKVSLSGITESTPMAADKGVRAVMKKGIPNLVRIIDWLQHNLNWDSAVYKLKVVADKILLLPSKKTQPVMTSQALTRAQTQAQSQAGERRQAGRQGRGQAQKKGLNKGVCLGLAGAPQAEARTCNALPATSVCWAPSRVAAARVPPSASSGEDRSGLHTVKKGNSLQQQQQQQLLHHQMQQLQIQYQTQMQPLQQQLQHLRQQEQHLQQQRHGNAKP